VSVPVVTDNGILSISGRITASSTDSSTAVDKGVWQLYERYQAAERDAERREITLEMWKLDRHRHAGIYDALEGE
jgi:hypothetical protein